MTVLVVMGGGIDKHSFLRRQRYSAQVMHLAERALNSQVLCVSMLRFELVIRGQSTDDSHMSVTLSDAEAKASSSNV